MPITVARDAEPGRPDRRPRRGGRPPPRPDPARTRDVHGREGLPVDDDRRYRPCRSRLQDRRLRALPRQRAGHARALLTGDRPRPRDGATGSAGSADGRTAWRERLRSVVAAYLRALAAGPAVAWAAMVEVQAAGRPALARRREVLDRYINLIAGFAAELADQYPDEVRPIRRELVLAAVGGINELILARVERGEADRLGEDADLAADVVIGLLERR